MMNNRIRIAIQKSGRLSEESFKLLENCGIYVNPLKEQLFCHSDNFPLDLLLVRDDDIPSMVAEGICDYGIVGTNVLQEKFLQNNSNLNKTNEIVQYLGFASCRLSIALPKNRVYLSLTCLSQLRIATSYPNILNQFIKKNNLNIEVRTLAGSVEIAPRLGIADGICDLVSSGATLTANNLREVETIFNSQAVLIKSSQSFSYEKQFAAKLFQNRLLCLENTINRGAMQC